ncbi:MAG: hypothetical protein AMS26_23870 [Bacteroides sp. SM23_62]|nr:MAG: hypothetical protein AMS26_23870 [Bacteroides sp. SM23_62]
MLISGLFILTNTGCSNTSNKLKVGIFITDVTPPIGSPVAYADARSIVDSLRAKGIVILSDEEPVVLCSVDWIGIGNEGQDAWRESLAKAAGTSTDRVVVHTVHQHDGVSCDFTVESILDEYGLGGWKSDTTFLRSAIQSVAAAVEQAKQNALPVTHLGFGQAMVEKVASNRRIIGEDGLVKITRWSRTTDSAAIAAPEGLIDPWLKCISFWNEDQAIAVLNYYATHPMSHYGQGDVSSDFPGIARDRREKKLGIPHIYFSGAGGNITAGKYNDGSPENRHVLAARLEKAMREAWEKTEKTPITVSDFDWYKSEVMLPLSEHLVEEELVARLSDPKSDSTSKLVAADHLAWLRRTQEGHKVNVSSARFGNVWLLSLPGETFIEYQLAAQEIRPGEHVCTAAYEEYGPGYVCTEIAYSQGGYESSERASCVSPGVEKVLLAAITDVLK